MADLIDLREVAGCTCQRVRRLARQLTQAYDRALAGAGLTVNQFGLLARLHGATQGGQASISIGALAERLGMHPTTLNRDLKPLKAQRLVADAVDPRDRRIRAVTITRDGRAKLGRAVPSWRRAQKRIEAALGGEGTRTLNEILDRAVGKLED